MDDERKKRAWVLQAFPVVIDPATAAIEVQADIDPPTGGWVAPQALTWRMLQRVQPREDAFAFPILNFAPNLYGLDQEIETCPFLLAYTTLGVLYSLLYKDDGEWVQTEFGEEITGQLSAHTSVRVFFPRGEDSKLFLDALEQARRSVMLNRPPTQADCETLVAALLSNNVPPRLINVATLDG
jgi:hypothetical protein